MDHAVRAAQVNKHTEILDTADLALDDRTDVNLAE